METLTREFVKKVCGARPPSHGVEHAEEVCEKAIIYLKGEQEYQQSNKKDWLMLMTKVVGLGHDVADHKYDKDGKLKQELEKFLQENFPDYHLEILKAIDNVSFSKEDKKRKAGEITDPAAYWKQELGEFALIRHAVSDADKSLATGSIGVKRTEEYQEEYYEHEIKDTVHRQKIKKQVYEHMHDKAARLHEFMMTEEGKREEQILRQEMFQALEMFMAIP